MDQELKIGTWFKEQPEDRRETFLMTLSLLHLALQDKRFIAVETTDCVLTIELRGNMEISNGEEDTE